MSRPYHGLRMLMYASELTQSDIARKLRVSVHTVSDRLNGHSEWTLSEAYALLELLEQPEEALPKLFPPRREK